MRFNACACYLSEWLNGRWCPRRRYPNRTGIMSVIQLAMAGVLAKRPLHKTSCFCTGSISFYFAVDPLTTKTTPFIRHWRQNFNAWGFGGGEGGAEWTEDDVGGNEFGKTSTRFCWVGTACFIRLITVHNRICDELSVSKFVATDGLYLSRVEVPAKIKRLGLMSNVNYILSQSCLTL